MSWEPEDEPGWQLEMLRRMPPSVDETMLAEMKRLTPIERFRRWQKLMERARQLRRAGEEHAADLLDLEALDKLSRS